MYMIKSILENKYLNYFVVFVLAITFSALTVYVAVQQSLRQSANDPQVQIAEDIVSELNAGADPSGLNSQNKTDMAGSLSPYLMIYDGDNKLMGSTGQLDGEVPIVPTGVLDAAKKNGENRVTWQPKSGVRVALVVKSFSAATSGFVVVGRSLREIEIREANTLKIVAICWLVSIIIAFAIMMLLSGDFKGKFKFRFSKKESAGSSPENS